MVDAFHDGKDLNLKLGHRKPFESSEWGELPEQIWVLEKELTSVL